jgi:hypothetical protein
MVNTELPLAPSTGPGGKGPPSPQWTWLSAELQAINRSETPWVVAMGHRPNFMASPLGELLWQNGVDLTIAG